MDFKINHNFIGKSINEFLHFYRVAKSTIYKIESNKLVRVNNQIVKLNYILKVDDTLNFDNNQSDPNKVIPYQGKIDIVYEDNDILIVNKPPFMLVHTDGNTLDTLSNRVSYYAVKNNYEGTVKHAHRIDYETSGMVIYTKHFLAHSYISSLFESRLISKTYVCWRNNKFNALTGVIDSKIGKDRHENKQRISKTGKEAVTKYKVLVNDKVSKVAVEIIGGRKHQIRVHMASINHPIVGDKLYGRSDNKRLLLHFKTVKFIHPRTLEEQEFNCPEDF
mgnify:CR=1 FL=1